MTNVYQPFGVIAAAALSLAVVSFIPDEAKATQIISTFDSDIEGWTILHSNGVEALPDFFATGGNPDGYISGTDTMGGGPYAYQAPSKFLGNQSSLYDGMLNFDLIVNMLNAPADGINFFDVVLGSESADLEIWFDLSPEPTTSWTSYSLLLSETGGWSKKSTGIAATKEEIQTVLSDLTSLAIRGDWHTIIGPDTSGIDNVAFVQKDASSQVPEPSTILGTMTFGLIGWLTKKIKTR